MPQLKWHWRVDGSLRSLTAEQDNRRSSILELGRSAYIHAPNESADYNHDPIFLCVSGATVSRAFIRLAQGLDKLNWPHKMFYFRRTALVNCLQSVASQGLHSFYNLPILEHIFEAVHVTLIMRQNYGKHHQ